MNYKEFFNQKKIAVIGIGPHGEMVTDIKFLVRSKALVSVYEIRNEKRLKGVYTKLKDIGLEKLSFGSIDEDTLLSYELIIISSETSRKSSFLKKANQAQIPIEYSETLFFKLSPPITLVGVLGQYGKSIVSHVLHNLLKKSFQDIKDQGLFFIDPDSDYGALTHLRKIKKDDLVIARIPEQLAYEYKQIHISPHVAVITSLIDFDILDSQTYNNFIVAPDEVVDALKLEKNVSSKAKILRTRATLIPAEWNIDTNIEHQKENAALILQASELFKVSKDNVRDILQNSLGMKGSVEFVKKINGIEFYNDSNSVNPHSTLSALRSLSSNNDTVLIFGGAYTGHDYTKLVGNINQYISHVILLPGSGTLGIRPAILEVPNIAVIQVLTLEDAVLQAYTNCVKMGKVIFSPGFEAVGIDISRKARGERFVKAVRNL